MPLVPTLRLSGLLLVAGGVNRFSGAGCGRWLQAWGQLGSKKLTTAALAAADRMSLKGARLCI
ncbi:MAG: hypothetical protein RQ754_13665 [Desulfuromonadales bacterium]|nr:hypothetical protein [Desulfuromonadales bacterium]